MGHVERFERFVTRPRLERGPDGKLGWRPDYKSRSSVSSSIAYGQLTDFGVKTSLAAMSATLLLQSNDTVPKIIFFFSTVILGGVAIASAFETF
jgi:hypothetical protein